jgi:methionyl-tRNA formyltransferase
VADDGSAAAPDRVTPMRVAFLGNARWSVTSLDALASSPHRPVLVATREPKPAGRGSKLRPTPVAGAARRLELPLREFATVKSGPGFDALAAARPEVLVVVAYGEILPRAVLDLPAVMPVNLHFSLLPELRGAAPVQRALLEGLTSTGVTTIRMDEGMDTGPILLQATETIDPADDAGSLGERLAAIGGRLLVDTLDRLEGGTLEECSQDGGLATFAPKLEPEDEVIDWSEPAEAIVRRVRALSPEPGARTTFRERRLKVHRASGANDGFEPRQTRPAGTVVAVSRDALVVATGRGSLALEEVQLEGKRRLSGPEFARGHRVEAGERLG